MLKPFIAVFYFLLASTVSAQIDVLEAPPPQIDYEREAGYRDSVAMHEGSSLHYQPHRCKNRQERFGWVDKYHKVVIPFDYQELPEYLSDFNPAKKGGYYGAIDAKGKVIIPFQYTSLTPYYPQRLVVCREASYEITVFDLEGKVILPAEKLYNIWLFGDTSIAVQDFEKKDVKIYDLQGRYIKTWTYSHIYLFTSGRIGAMRDSMIVFNRITLQGVLGPDGQILVPLEYTAVAWEQGDWARVANHISKIGGLFQISTQTLYQDNYYKVNPPDPLGNFTFWEGATGEQARAGLMDAQFKVIFHPAYFDIRYLDEKGHYVLHGGRSNRGYLRGVGDAKGQVVIDTVMLGFEPIINRKEIGQNLRGQWNVEYDTLPFLIFEDVLTSKKGLWHRQLGQLRSAGFDQFSGVSPTAFIQEKGDTSYLFHIDGHILAGPFYRINPHQLNCYLVARPTLNTEYILLDLEGRFIRKLESEPHRLTDGIYKMHQYVNNPSGNGKFPKYGLFDKDLHPITGFIFDSEPHAMFGLNTRQKIRVLDREHPSGFGPWIGYMRKGLEETFTLMDGTGKTLEIQPN